MVRALGSVFALVLVVVLIEAGGASSAGNSTRFLESPEITYMADTVSANRCAGPSPDLHYKVFYPNDQTKLYPIVFGMKGSGYDGTADCDLGVQLEKYRSLDSQMKEWADAGWVAVNVEYHGKANGRFGRDSYPGPNWGSMADGTVELNVKRAVQYFFDHNPGQWGADETKGIVAFGGSSGGHNAYMLALTAPVAGHQFAAAIGFSGAPDAADSGTAEGPYIQYMCDGQPVCPNQDVYNFGDPYHRIGASSPAQYVANSVGEFVAYQNAENYWQRCRDLNVIACWIRIVKGDSHGMGYAHQVFDPICDPECDLHVQPAARGVDVLADAIAFAQRAIPG